MREMIIGVGDGQFTWMNGGSAFPEPYTETFMYCITIWCYFHSAVPKKTPAPTPVGTVIIYPVVKTMKPGTEKAYLGLWVEASNGREKPGTLG